MLARPVLTKVPKSGPKMSSRNFHVSTPKFKDIVPKDTFKIKDKDTTASINTRTRQTDIRTPSIDIQKSIRDLNKPIRTFRPLPDENAFPKVKPVVIKAVVKDIAKWESLGSREQPMTPEIAKEAKPFAMMAKDAYESGDSRPTQNKLEGMGISSVPRSEYPEELLKELEEKGLVVDEDGQINDVPVVPIHIRTSSGDLEELETGAPLMHDPDSYVGLKARLYRNDNSGEMTIAFAGSAMNLVTDPRARKNWIRTNAPNFLGSVTAHDKRALELTETLQKYSGENLKNVTGHSLAGGTAKFISGMTDMNGVTFNAAGLTKAHEELMRQRGVSPNDVNCTNIVSGNDIVTKLSRGSEFAQRLHSGIYGLSDTSGTPGPIYNTGKNTGHGMGDLADTVSNSAEGIEVQQSPTLYETVSSYASQASSFLSRAWYGTGETQPIEGPKTTEQPTLEQEEIEQGSEQHEASLDENDLQRDGQQHGQEQNEFEAENEDLDTPQRKLSTREKLAQESQRKNTVKGHTGHSVKEDAGIEKLKSEVAIKGKGNSNRM
jgi:hypothetical protein